MRWGDKHGGYGEHYWDYNHAGHDGHDGEESQHDEHYAKYDEEESQNSPVHQEAPKTSIPKRLQPYASTYIPLASRDKRQPEGPVNLGAKEILSNGDSQKTYFADFLSSRDKRQPEEQANLSLGKPLRAGDKQKEIQPLISDFQAFREKRQPNSEGQVILDLEELLRAMDVQKSIQPLSSGYQPSRDKREPNSEGSVGSQIAFEDSERLGSEYSPRGKRQPGINTEDVEFIDDRARYRFFLAQFANRIILSVKNILQGILKMIRIIK